jgi:hypothetical protein
LIHGGTDEEDGKFIPSVTIARIDIVSDGMFDDLTDAFQDLIPFQMAVEIIISFEIVEVEHQKLKGGLLTFQTSQFGLQGFEKKAVVIKAG